MDKTHLLDMTLDDWQAWVREQGLPAYRYRQLRHWIFEHVEGDFSVMSDLPKSLRAQLADNFVVWSTEVANREVATDGTEKLLLRLADGETVECVLIRDRGDRRTACISTQVGCAMRCAFCASGAEGLVRNLTTGEILEQVLRIKQCLGEKERLSHIVVMGMGEPLANLDNLLPALATVCHSEGLGISARRVTISTVGIPKAIRRLADHGTQYHLAISLHAPTDELRNKLVPVNRGTGIKAIINAADYYFEQTGRRVTYEYVLLADVNDKIIHARQLASLLRGRAALVNVIPYNPVPDKPFRTPTAEAVYRFVRELEDLGISVQIRQRRGDSIEAACGQLRRRHITQGTPECSEADK